MSITSDIRTYADSALEQGKQAVGQAQNQINDVTGQANQFVVKLAGTAKNNVSGLTQRAVYVINDLRTQAEKTVNIDGIKTAVEPYLAQAKQYRDGVADRAQGIVKTVKNDDRVARVITTAESLTGVVVETVQDRVVRPVASLTGRGSKPVAHKPAAPGPAARKPVVRTTKPAAARPAAKKAPARTTAIKSAARKAPAKKATKS